MSATEELEALRGKVAEAEGRARELKAAEAAAKHELREARANLARAEVDDPTGKQLEAARGRLERARVAVEHEPWSERAQLARNAVGRAQGAVRRFVLERFPELLEAKEAEAEAPKARQTAACQTIIDTNLELQRLSGEISSLWLMVTQPQQGDVWRTDTQALISAASALIEQGSEGLTLRRDRMAWVLAAEEPVPDEEPVPA